MRLEHESLPFEIGDRVLYKRRRRWNPSASQLLRAVYGDSLPPGPGITATGTVVGLDLTSKQPVKVDFDERQRDASITIGTNKAAWVPLDAIEPMPAVDQLAEVIEKKDD